MHIDDLYNMVGISEENKRRFEALRDPAYDNFALHPCFVNGEPAVAIVAINKYGRRGDGKREVGLQPLFVSITPGMKLTNHEGVAPTTSKEHEKQERKEYRTKRGAGEKEQA